MQFNKKITVVKPGFGRLMNEWLITDTDRNSTDPLKLYVVGKYDDFELTVQTFSAFEADRHTPLPVGEHEVDEVWQALSSIGIYFDTAVQPRSSNINFDQFAKTVYPIIVRRVYIAANSSIPVPEENPNTEKSEVDFSVFSKAIFEKICAWYELSPEQVLKTYSLYNDNESFKNNMKLYTKEQLESAADDFALSELGPEQFDINPNARQAIRENFISGVEWVAGVINDAKSMAIVNDNRLGGELKSAEIKKFANQLNDEQLGQSVVFVEDEMSSRVDAVSELGDDHYYFIDSDYRTTKEDYDPDMMEGKTFEEALESEEHVMTPASNIYLFGL